jgi:acyl carrier protein
MMSSSQSAGLQPDQILERLRAIVSDRLDLTPEQIDALSPDLPIVEGLQLDSLAQVTLIAGIEDEFHVELNRRSEQSWRC